MRIIVAVDKHWAIGNRNQLLVNIPQDQKRFRDETLGKVIIMGRKTLESLPGGQPLYGRENIVLSRDKGYKAKGVTICHTTEEVLSLVEERDSDQVYIIGGEEIYRQFLPFCDQADVTWIDFAYDADARFPNLDDSAEWELTEESDEQTYFDLCYTYRTYRRK